MSLKRYLCLVLLAAWNIGSWVFLINVPFPVSSLFIFNIIVYIDHFFILSQLSFILIQMLSPGHLDACWPPLLYFLGKRQ